MPVASDPPDEASPPPGVGGGFGTATATFVIISSMIGVGVLTTSGLAVERLGSNQLMLALWAIGGVIALCGALSLAEVSAALPRSGGEYAIFREAYGRLPAFLAGWVSFLFGFAGPIAMAATGAVDYLLAPLGDRVPGPGPVRPLLATGLIAAIAAFHVSGRERSIRLQGFVTLAEVGFLAAFAAAGLWAGRGGVAHLADRPPVGPDTLGGMLFGLLYVSYGYTGWNAASYIAGEIRAPGRDLPRAIVLGTLAVTVLYLGLNLVYALAVPASVICEMARTGGRETIVPIAQVAASRLFGPSWAGGLAVGVGLMMVATLSALLLTGPRVLLAMAQDGVFPTRAARTSRRDGTPAVATSMLAGSSVLLIWSGSFDAILLYSGVGLALTSLLSVASVIVLRWRRPSLIRPFRVPGYPWVPLLFLATTSALTIAVIRAEPGISALSMLSIAAGCPIYLALVSRASRTIPSGGTSHDL
ncbi:APC family permease [Tundrisphaera sp. TA3]|uniref:APC family permease n=1 Tax=Tundrisphaera sp. TA3 TaxID=3435775 RepID=UPI003EB836D5